jgi:hypothetical protein
MRHGQQRAGVQGTATKPTQTPQDRKLKAGVTCRIHLLSTCQIHFFSLFLLLMQLLLLLAAGSSIAAAALLQAARAQAAQQACRPAIDGASWRPPGCAAGRELPVGIQLGTCLYSQAPV